MAAAKKKVIEEVIIASEEEVKYIDQPIKFRYQFKTWKEYWAYKGRKG